MDIKFLSHWESIFKLSDNQAILYFQSHARVILGLKICQDFLNGNMKSQINVRLDGT